MILLLILLILAVIINENFQDWQTIRLSDSPVAWPNFHLVWADGKHVSNTLADLFRVVETAAVCCLATCKT